MSLTRKTVIFHTLASDSFNKELKFNCNSPFGQVAQYLAEKYLLKPYPEEKANKKFSRFYHGVTHAACATYLADNASVLNGKLPYVDKENNTYHGGLFIELLKHYLPHKYWTIIQESNGGEDLTETDFLLLKYAIFCHDIGNTSENFKQETAHAEIFTKEMLALGFDADKVNKFADAIVNKDSKKDKNIIQMIIHDSDCLEINRVLTNKQAFKIDELDIIKVFKKYLRSPLLEIVLQEMQKIAATYYQLMEFIYRCYNDEIHSFCEFSKNSYLDTARIIQGFGIAKCSKSFLGVDDFLKINPSNHLSPLEIYCSYTCPKSIKEMKKYIFFESEEDCNEKDDAVLKQFQTEGVYIRRLEHEAQEYPVLKENKKTIYFHGITTSDQLRNYFINDKKTGEARLLSNFKFRPTTFIKQGCSVESYMPNKVGLLINPRAKSVLATHFFKGNVTSNTISKKFDFFRPGRVKNLKTLENLIGKFEEKKLRRQGAEWDNYNANYAVNVLQRSEILLTYDFDAVLGIVISENKDSASAAIRLWNDYKKETGKSLNFYHYDARLLGLQLVTRSEVLWWLGIRGEDEKFQTRYLVSSYAKEMEKKEIYYPDNNSSYGALIKKDPMSREHINCSIEKHNPTQDHPISYSFTIDKKEGLAYIKKGCPVVEMEGKSYYDTNSYIPSIVHRYQFNLVNQCNVLLDKLKSDIQHFLHAKNMRFVFAKDPRGKYYLQLHYEQVEKKPAFKPELILSYIGYIRGDIQKPWKWELMKTSDSGTYIRLSVLQSLDLIKKQLNHLLEKPIVRKLSPESRKQGLTRRS